jgi:hydrogenase maturation protein HypF
VAGLDDAYPYDIDAGGPWLIAMEPTIRAIVQDLICGASAGVISARFHNTVSEIVVEICERIRRVEKLSTVCLSGGTFQNQYLLKHAVTRLRRAGFDVYLQTQVPANDGGLSLGQAVIASRVLG